MAVLKLLPCAVRLGRRLLPSSPSTLRPVAVPVRCLASKGPDNPKVPAKIEKSEAPAKIEKPESPTKIDASDATPATIEEQAARLAKLAAMPDQPDFLNLDLDQHAPPMQRVYQILRNDFKNAAKGKIFIPYEHYFPTYCDIAIVGGGIIGSAIAYFLKQRARKGLHIVVIEKDPTYSKSSTTLSVGGIRQQFSLPENIQMSQYGAEFLRTIKEHLTVPDKVTPEVYFNPHGYLFLASEAGADVLRENHRVQSDCGVKVDLLTARQLKNKFPWLNTDGIALGSCGYGQEGWFDPYLLLMAFKEKAISLGVQYVNAELVGFQFKASPGVQVIDEGEHTFQKLSKLVVKMKDGVPREISPAFTYLACGANTGVVGQLATVGCGPGMLKYPIPVEPRKRYVYTVHCPEGPGLECPLVIDPTGTYFRREGLGGHYLCGKSPAEDEEPDCSNLDVDYAYFDDVVWPNLAKRVPAFESLKLHSAWAGYYDYNTYDQNAIIGPHPYFPNLIMACGFSGHGLQQAPAIGRAMMEHFIDGGFKTIDLSRFYFDRMLSEKPVYEQAIV